MKVWLIISVSALIMIGLITLLSTSYLKGLRDADNGFIYVQRQLLWVCISFAAMCLISTIPIEKIFKVSFPLLILSMIFLVAVLLPGIGTEYNGARRWFRFGGFGFQPSEFAKLALMLFLSSYICKRRGEIGRNFKTFFLAFIAILAVCILIFFEPDFGNTLFVFTIGMIALFVGGARLIHIIPSLLICFILFFSIALFKFDYIKKRLPLILGMGQNVSVQDYQKKQSMITIASGGLVGEVLGQSKQKLQYLPEGHSDFSLSIFCEEMGFTGFIGMILLFVIFFYSGLKIAFGCTGSPSGVFAVTLLLYIWLQLIINIGVISGVLPTKGINTPFLGAGGSNLFFILCGIGVILALPEYEKKYSENKEI